jgi:hypothetical protein
MNGTECIQSQREWQRCTNRCVRRDFAPKRMRVDMSQAVFHLEALGKERMT